MVMTQIYRLDKLPCAIRLSAIQATVRGLQEELGIAVQPDQIDGPLSPCHQRILEIPGLIKDVEFVTCYR